MEIGERANSRLGESVSDHYKAKISSKCNLKPTFIFFLV